MPTTRLDMRGIRYTMPIVKLARAIKKGRSGDVFELTSDYPGIGQDVEKWCATTGNRLKSMASSDGLFTISIVKK